MGIIARLTGKDKTQSSKKILELTPELIKEALTGIIDPDLHENIVSLGFVRDIVIKDSNVSLSINLTTPACPVKEHFKKQAEEALAKIPGIGDIQITMTAVSPTAPKYENGEVSSLGRVKNILAVASGKGGVGKSTTSIHLAKALALSGAKVGLMDADVYGPSIPHATGVGTPTEMNGKLLIPPSKDGIKMVSISMFASADGAQILRGPMAGNVVKQFLTQVDWGELDYLIIDYPPGTGDIQLTISQTAPITAGVIVTTPQEMALIDVRKAISMFNTMKVPVLGIIENMSYFICDGCDKKHYLFNHGGGHKIANEFGLPFLGEIPLEPIIGNESEKQRTVFEKNSSSAISKAIQDISDNAVRALSVLQNKKISGLESFHLTWK
ncbi:MAG: Mrp/NBP35 family ATP-binding protein [Bdellovibrionota bacterium]